MMNALLLLAAGLQGGTQLPAKPLPSTRLALADGNALTIPAPGSKATVVIFVLADCPIANRLAPEIARIGQDYTPKGVTFALAYPDSEITWADVQKHGTDYALGMPATIDRKLTLLRALGATVTPQAAVLDPKGRVRYLGRINDLFEEHGRTRSAITRNDLRIALDEMLAGKPVSMPVTQAIGCFVGG